MLKTGIVSLIIRSGSLFSKLLMMLYIAKYLSPEDLGLYGIMLASVTFSRFVLGFEFYYYVQRELLKNKEDKWSSIFRDQIVFYSWVYIIILPFFIIFFLVGTLAWKYIIWFYVILILEHLTNEIQKLLVVIYRPILANFVSFLNSGLWIYIYVIVSFFFVEYKHMSYVWLLWTLGDFVALIVGVYGFWKLNWKQIFVVKINKAWIKKGIKVALPFLGIAISLKIIELSDRFFIQSYLGEASVGIYFLFQSIAMLPLTFVESGAGMILGPKIIAAFQKNNYIQYKYYYRKLILSTIILSVFTFGIIYIFIYKILEIINKHYFVNYISVYWILLAVAAISIVGNLNQLSLYVRNLDRILLITILIAMFFSLFGNFVFISHFGLIGAAITKVFSISILLITRTIMLNRAARRI